MSYSNGRPVMRFIPAGAGNSMIQPFSKPASAVYPRWRGELFLSPDDRPQNLGLSPLARGTHHKDVLKKIDARFIPAGAGNSVAQAPVLITGAVYPRWRGELITKSTTMMINFGLSPLARGTPRVLR